MGETKSSTLLKNLENPVLLLEWAVLTPPKIIIEISTKNNWTDTILRGTDLSTMAAAAIF